MRTSTLRTTGWQRALGGLGLVVSLCATGCQVDVGGQTLPSPYYQNDDVQYFAPGPEFKLSREAAAQKAFKEDAAAAEGADGRSSGGGSRMANQNQGIPRM